MDPALRYRLLGAGYSAIEDAHVDVEWREEGMRVQKKQNIADRRLRKCLQRTTQEFLGNDAGVMVDIPLSLVFRASSHSQGHCSFRINDQVRSTVEKVRQESTVGTATSKEKTRANGCGQDRDLTCNV